MQGSLRTGLIPYLSFAVLIIGWVSLFAFVVGLIVLYRYLRLLSDLLGGADVSAVGTTLLQSPGWNEGKARNATLGKHVQERIELRRSGTFGASVCRGVVPPLWGSINVFQ